ncbi:MAG: hypothetical protein EMLJLAPB_00861 [Candidatus Argoarchaeum ethanivorans]|uniref:DUF485 domain-containing protein n=1 Tax=Candidatus Argoarchaeum ethanivorans TaxID=2608793 RepID=A0A811TFV6_9EURY|nr:MAG: hypothetical protein EMLJLAPB_00861 [Candidatus Argoarchaeum ethanivorans]
MVNKISEKDIVNDKDFKDLISKRNTIAVTLSIVQLLLYFGFIALVAYNKPYLGRTISPTSDTTIGIPIAIGVIVISIILGGIFAYWANTSYDASVKKIIERMEVE